ncbi:MAG: gamma-glutamylcyclotransferase family protein [Pseudomonadota bacterium]
MSAYVGDYGIDPIARDAALLMISTMPKLTPNHRLATYGTLAPGRSNAHELEGLSGRWLQGFVRGHLVESGWGAAQGYPGIHLHEEAPRVDVFLLESEDLPEHWSRLDAFEGAEYERVTVEVQTDEGVLEASIYALRPEPSE